MPLEVESFHINVGAGDGAIHLLTRDADPAPPPNTDPNVPPPPPHDDRRVVVQAFLIDGGVAACLPKINKTINRIEDLYKCPCPYKTGNYLMFDGFIISHWDRDHFGGVIKWLYEELCLSDRTDQNANMGSGWSFPRAYYADDWGAKSFVYWPPRVTTDSSQLNMFEVTNANPNANPGMLRIRGGVGEVKQGEDLAKARTSWPDLLARNIFRQQTEPHKQFNTTQLADIESLDLLYASNAIAAPDGTTGYNYTEWPAMYCIAAETRRLGSTARIEVTDTNKSSLVFIIAWNHDDGSKHVSHYFGGDIHTNMEREITTWIQPAHQNPIDGQFPVFDPALGFVTSMKLSHHGAMSSNPEEVFHRFYPRNITVSAGEANGHPSRFP